MQKGQLPLAARPKNQPPHPLLPTFTCLDVPLGKDFGDHGDEYRVVRAQLVDKGTQRAHDVVPDLVAGCVIRDMCVCALCVCGTYDVAYVLVGRWKKEERK